ncbi:MAG TPA: tyrosine-protein phosphatase [Sphingobium sp.]
MSSPAFAAPARLPLEGAFNLRDFGGYATADGRSVRRGMLYRSGTMALLTQDDAEHLRSLGIRAICDFRRGNERSKEPTRWHGQDVDYYCRDYSGSSGVLGDMLRSGSATVEDMREAMLALYRRIAIDHAEAYGAMFGQILAGRLPLLINCTAGKDRTGAGAVLILAALGVPRATIVEDYLLTNAHADWEWLFAQGETTLSRLRADMADVVAPVLTADAAYVAALFQQLDADHGGVEGYLADILGIDATAREAMRGMLLD